MQSNQLAQYVQTKTHAGKFANSSNLTLGDIGRFFNSMSPDRLELSLELASYLEANEKNSLTKWVTEKEHTVRQFLFGENKKLYQAFKDANRWAYFDNLFIHLKKQNSITDIDIEDAFVSSYLLVMTYPWMENLAEKYPTQGDEVQEFVLIVTDEQDKVSRQSKQKIAMDTLKICQIVAEIHAKSKEKRQINKRLEEIHLPLLNKKNFFEDTFSFLVKGCQQLTQCATEIKDEESIHELAKKIKILDSKVGMINAFEDFKERLAETDGKTPALLEEIN